MKDIKITMKEMDDLFQVVYELMSEQITEALKYIEEKKEQDAVKKPVQNKKRRVIEKIEVDNNFEQEEKCSPPYIVLTLPEITNVVKEYMLRNVCTFIVLTELGIIRVEIEIAELNDSLSIVSTPNGME